MRLSLLLSGAALLADGFFVLGRPLSTRQVAGDWNQISPLPSGSDWIGRLPNLSNVPNTFDGVRIANANLDAPPQNSAISEGQTFGIGGPIGSSSDADSFPVEPEVPSNQLLGDIPVTTNMLPTTGSSLALAPAYIGASVLTDEFQDPRVVYVLYALENNKLVVNPDYWYGYNRDWETFRVPFENTRPGFALYRSPEKKFYSFTNLMKSHCKGSQDVTMCTDDAKMVLSIEDQWNTAVRNKYSPVILAGQIYSDEDLQRAGNANGIIWPPASRK